MKMQKLYLPNSILTKLLLTKCPKLKKVLYNFESDESKSLYGLGQLPKNESNPTLYLSSYINWESSWIPAKAQCANVSFQLNYEDEVLNGYYWIDDLDNEIISVIPPDPEREEYTFEGWYKEPECLNHWDFAKDKVPAKEYDEDGAYLYRETKLYAKWKIEQMGGEKAAWRGSNCLFVIFWRES